MFCLFINYTYDVFYLSNIKNENSNLSNILKTFIIYIYVLTLF